MNATTDDRTDSSDEDLMLQYAAGDAAAFDRLYTRHRGSLFRFIQRQFKERAQAEEIFQEVWMNLITSRERYTVAARFRTYLYTLAHNRMVDHFRRHSGEPLWVDNDSEEGLDVVANLPASRLDEPHVRAISRQQGQYLLRLLEGLPSVQREAFLLAEEGGLSLGEIAEATGVSFETAKSRLRYAIAKLRAGLQKVAA
ncbi:MAG: sigma-70 family RNA polymerase sigma factor [Azoarcus sp.]|jgi:RNA polymerase sigma-70 factor (ECF subfamily)|nr:sigma-70 family RNA polymerase sigma factor [Azoarcus sp.]